MPRIPQRSKRHSQFTRLDADGKDDEIDGVADMTSTACDVEWDGAKQRSSIPGSSSCKLMGATSTRCQKSDDDVFDDAARLVRDEQCPCHKLLRMHLQRVGSASVASR